jgi:hypothetical protein
MQHRDGPVLSGDGAQQWQRDGVVTAYCHEAVRLRGELACATFDFGHSGVDAERVHRDVAGVGDLLHRERFDFLRGVEGAQEARRFTDVGWAEAGAGPVADAAVERHADDRNAGMLDLVEPGQAGECGDACEPWDDAGVYRADRRGLHISKHPISYRKL